MHSDVPIYESADAWLLLAIIYADQNGRGTLAKIIAAGDAINHAIFTPTELEAGLARLTRGGYVNEVEGIFVPLKRPFHYEGSARKNRMMWKELESVEKMLSVRQSLSSALDDSEQYPSFSLAKYESAIAAYRQGI